MRVWMIWVGDEDGTTWLEAAWDDDSTAENHAGWEAEVDRVRDMCAKNRGYQYRIQQVAVPGVHSLFEIPEVKAVRITEEARDDAA